jgi:hypothetical protein
LRLLRLAIEDHIGLRPPRHSVVDGRLLLYQLR